MCFVVKKKRKRKTSKDGSASSTISTDGLQAIVNKLQSHRFRDSTRETYYRVWKIFAEFFLRLDYKPIASEERLTLFTGHMIEKWFAVCNY